MSDPQFPGVPPSDDPDATMMIPKPGGRRAAMPAPSEKQRVVRLDLEPPRERRDGFAKLPRTGLRDAKIDDARDVLRVGLEGGARALDGVGIGKRSILHARG